MAWYDGIALMTTFARDLSEMSPGNRKEPMLDRDGFDAFCLVAEIIRNYEHTQFTIESMATLIQQISQLMVDAFEQESETVADTIQSCNSQEHKTYEDYTACVLESNSNFIVYRLQPYVGRPAAIEVFLYYCQLFDSFKFESV